jgi:hypothetical protein
MSLWFVSAPADPTKTETVSKLRDKISSKANDLADVSPFNLPEFKVIYFMRKDYRCDTGAREDERFKQDLFKQTHICLAYGMLIFLIGWYTGLACGSFR